MATAVKKRVKRTVHSNKERGDSFDKEHGVLSINFGDFDLDLERDPFNHGAAERIAMLLSYRISIDEIGVEGWELKYDEDKTYPKTTVGGGGSIELPAPTKSHLYACMASGFAGFAYRGRHDFYIGKNDYYHLKEVYEDLSDNTHIHRNDERLLPLKRTLEEFRLHYAEHDKTFLVELLKEA